MTMFLNDKQKHLSDRLGLVFFTSINYSEQKQRAKQSCNCLWVSVRVCWCALATDEMQHGSHDQHTARLVNRSANSAFCALLVFLVMATSIWWTFSWHCRENCNSSHSPLVSLSSFSFVITPSFLFPPC